MKLELAVEHDGIRAEICVTLTAPTSPMLPEQDQDDGELIDEILLPASQLAARQALAELWKVHQIFEQSRRKVSLEYHLDSLKAKSLAQDQDEPTP